MIAALNDRRTCGLLLVLALTGCGHSDPPAAATSKESNALPVRVAVVGGGAIAETLSAQGRLEAQRREWLSTRVAGFISELPVEDNQTVAAGQTVARLSLPADVVETGARAQLRLERAQRDLARIAALAAKAPDTLSAKEVDAARDAVADAAQERDEAQRRLRDCVIAAPYAGVLSGRAGTVGQQVVAGFQIGELHDTARYKVYLDLPETSLPRLRAGQAVEVIALADDSTAEGALVALPRSIDPAKGTGRALVEIAAPPAGWRPGGFVATRLRLGEVKQERIIPRDAVLYRQNRAFCWAVEERDGRLVARRAWLELGAGDTNRVAVVSGVSAGERIVVEGTAGLADGIAVAIRADAAVEGKR